MHTNLTLDILDEATISLGKQSCFFADKICPKFDTCELAREADARKLRASKSGIATASITTRKAKTFNLRTYKYHSLGDYGDTIRQHGTCDSYSTEPEVLVLDYHNILKLALQGELEHHSLKARYPRTDHTEFVRQMTQIERRQARVRRIRARNFKVNKPETENVPRDPDTHHHIGKSQNEPEHVSLFVQKYEGDPAVKVRAVDNNPVND